VKFTDDGLTTGLTMLGNTGDEVFTATGPLASIADRVPVVIVRRKGINVYFISVIEPVPDQMQPDLKGLSIIPGTSLTVSILRAEGEDVVSFEGENLGSFSVINKSGSGQKTVLRSE
jgi:hypothetical protein